MDVPSIEEQQQKVELLENNRKTIQDTIDSHVGQMLLVKVVRDIPDGCTGFGGKGHISRRTELSLGVPEEKTRYATATVPRIIVPVRSYMYSPDNRVWRKAEGPMAIELLDMLNLNAELPPCMPFAEPPDDISTLGSSLEVIAGDLDVAAHFSVGYAILPDEYKLLRKERREGRLSDEGMKQRISGSGKFSLDYVLAVKELGVSMLPELHKHVQNLKDGIIWKLYQRPKNPEEDLKIALMLDMHNEQRTFELAGEGLTVNVPEFIRRLCQRYEVKIPD